MKKIVNAIKCYLTGNELYVRLFVCLPDKNDVDKFSRSATQLQELQRRYFWSGWQRRHRRLHMQMISISTAGEGAAAAAAMQVCILYSGLKKKCFWRTFFKGALYSFS